MLQPAGAMNVLPAVVVRGVSAVSFSGRVAGVDGVVAVGVVGAVGVGRFGSGVDEGFDGDEQAANRSVTVKARMWADTITSQITGDRYKRLAPARSPCRYVCALLDDAL